MADIEKTIEIIFAGSDSGFSSSIDTVGRGLQDFSGNIGDLVDPLANVGRGILGVEAAAGALAAGGITYAIQKNGEFRAGLSEVNTMIGLGAGELSIYSDQVDEYSRSSTQSIDQILRSLYNAASLGVGYADSLDVVGAAERLAVGTKSELNDALETLVGTMNAYGAPMTEITGYSDTFFTIIRDGKTTLPELSTSIANVTGIASAAGIPFDTLGAAIAAMTAAGAPTSEAITRIRSAIESLLAPTPAASRAAAALGIDLSEAALRSRGFPAVLQEIYDRTGGSVEAMSTMITTTEGVQAALVLGADRSGIFARSLDDMANKAGATDTAFNQMADNQNLIWQNMVNNWDSMIRAFGASLDRNGNDLIVAFAGLWNSIRSSLDNGTFDPLLRLINEFTNGAEEAVNNLARNLPAALRGVDFSGFSDSVRDLANQILEFFDIDLSNQNSIQNSIQSIVNSFETLTRLSASMINAFTPVKDAIVELVEWFNGLDESTQRFIGTGLGIAVVASPMAVVGGSAAQMIQAFAGLTGVTASISGAGGLTASLGLLGPAVIAVGAAIGLVVGTDAFTRWLAGITAGAQEATPGQVALREALERYATLTGNPRLVTDIREMTNETHIAVGQFRALEEAVSGLPLETRMQIMSIFASQGFDAARTELDRINGREANVYARADISDLARLANAMQGIPEEKLVNVRALMDAGQFHAALTMVESISGEKTVNITANTAAAESNINVLKYQLEDGTWAEIRIDANERSVQDTKQRVERELDPLKRLEIQTELDIAQLEATTSLFESTISVLNTEIEWSARVDIAQIEADSEQAIAAFESIGESVAAVSDVVGSMFSDLAEMGNSSHFYELFGALNREMTMQEDLIAAQIRLIDAQVSHMERGEAIWTVSGENMSEAAMGFMYAIMDQIKIQNHADGGSSLMGI